MQSRPLQKNSVFILSYIKVKPSYGKRSQSRGVPGGVRVPIIQGEGKVGDCTQEYQKDQADRFH
jgi:hypothetical protein